MPERPLTIDDLRREAGDFAAYESAHSEPALFGVTDGKAIGTYVEHKFQAFLALRYSFAATNSALGVDFPSLDVDVKVTSITQPQSSCPFRSARQKIYGLGYHLLVFVYEKSDDRMNGSGRLNFLHVVFIEAAQTADFQTTKGIRGILDNGGNDEDLIAFMMDRNLPVDSIGAAELAREIQKSTPEQGYLTISNALQWRLQYRRAIERAGEVSGISRIR